MCLQVVGDPVDPEPLQADAAAQHQPLVETGLVEGGGVGELLALELLVVREAGGVVGVILNKAGSSRHADEVVRSIGDRLPVLGVLQRDDGIEAPSRHLGLVPAAERADAAAALDRLAAQVADRIDLEQVVRLASAAPDLAEAPWDPLAGVVQWRTVAGRPSGRHKLTGLPRGGGRVTALTLQLVA